MQAALQVFSKRPEILPARGLRNNKKRTKCKFIHEKVIPRSARLIWSAEKSNLEQTIMKIGQSPLSMQAVPLASNIF